jgi:hypothetical protein
LQETPIEFRIFHSKRLIAKDLQVSSMANGDFSLFVGTMMVGICNRCGITKERLREIPFVGLSLFQI